MYQTDIPKKDQLIANITTNLGEIKICLFENDAPNCVENFVNHAKEGYYDGTIFHRVIKDFMIQGGDPQGSGYGGESIWKKPFEDEFSENLKNIRGALSMANSGPNTNGSQFFIVQMKEVPENMLSQLADGGWPQPIVEAYGEKGGTPWLDQKHTVFGQLIEGESTLEDIAN
ncbi:MAG: peptidylprolyl isomerase, partial [Streptococcus sp.]|nr:peptidylprolyl isomerase [Streptococcus sp.]